MSITQLIFGLVTGVILATVGILGMTLAITDSSLLIVGLTLALINITFWAVQHRKPVPIKIQISNTPNK